MVGAPTSSVAVLLAAPAVGVCVVFTPEVTLGSEPTVVLVTLNVTVQLLLAGMVIPVKLSAVTPAVKVDGVVPTHVPPTAPPTALIFASVSVKAPPVSAAVSVFFKVSVTVEAPPGAIDVGLNALAMVAAPTSRIAVLLAVPAVGVCVVVTPEVVLGSEPTVVLVTLNVTVQLLLLGMVIPVKLSAVTPAVKVDGVVPTQVPATAPPSALILTSVSVNAPPVSAVVLPFFKVSVTVEDPPDAIEVELNALVIVGETVTVRSAVLLAAPAVGVCVVFTPEVVLGSEPAVVLVTLNVTVQLPLAGMLIAVKLRAVLPAVKVAGVVPVQVPPTAPPTALIFDSVSVNAPPVSAEVLLFDKVSVTVDGALDSIDVGLNALAMVGAASAVTVRSAVLLAVPAVGVCVVFTPEVVLGFAPVVVLVTLNVTVQLPLAGMLIAVKLRAVAPAVNVAGVVPVQVPPTAPPTALIFASVSVNAPPVSAEVLLLVKVNVTVEDPPDGIEAGLKAFAIVGAASAVTVRSAVLLAVPAVGVCVVFTPEVVLGLVPVVVLVTLNVTVQLPLAGMVIALKLSEVAPAVKLDGLVPTQVPPTAPPSAVIFESVSVNAPPLRAIVLLFVKVRVTTELPPGAIEVGLKAFAMVGVASAVTVRSAVLLAVPAGPLCVVLTPEVVLGLGPVVVLVTLKVTVQLPLAGMVIPLKLRAVVPAVKLVGVVPEQVPPTAPPSALMFDSVSVNAPPVRAEVLLLVKVSVTVEDPPEVIEVGLNALAIVGG